MPRVLMVKADVGAVRQAERERLLSCAELCECAGCSGKSLWLFRTGRPVGVAVARRIAAAFGVPLSTTLASTRPGGRGCRAERGVRIEGDNMANLLADVKDDYRPGNAAQDLSVAIRTGELA